MPAASQLFRPIYFILKFFLLRLCFVKQLPNIPHSVQVERAYRVNFEKKRVMEQEGPTRIVIAVNQSSLKGYPHPSISSRNAFEWVLKKLIRSTRHQDFKLYILHVQVPDRHALNDVDSIFACPEDFKDLKNRKKIKSIDLLEYFVRGCNEIGLACEAWIKIGDPKEVICNEVKRLCPDILVVGSRGLNRLERVFVGTVSEYCSKHADCPIMVIKRKPEDTPQNPVDD